MNKLITLSLALALSFGGTALCAQEPEPPAGGEKSREEMIEELRKLMDEASKEMDKAEAELAKASLPASKADVIAERVKALKEALKKGDLKDVPEGLREYLRQNPEKGAEAAGMSVEEFKKLLESQDKLDEAIKKNKDLQRKIGESEEAMEKVLEHQHQAERKIEETLKKQQQAMEKAKESADKSIDLAHQLRQQGGGKGQGDMKNNDQKTKDPREQQDKQNQAGNPNKNADKPYDPNSGEKPPEDKEVTDNKHDPNAFKAEARGKDLKDGASNEGGSGAPSKYKGFWERWSKQIQERNKAAKEARKDAAPKDK